MITSLISLVISIIAAFFYDVLKQAYQSRDKSTSKSSTYSSKYVSSVKREFYISFFIGICFSCIPSLGIQFFDILFTILKFFSFFISLMGFMCLVDVAKHFLNEDSND